MNTQIEHLDNHTVRLTVEVAPERVEKAMQVAARRIAKEVNIPGFRKGKAPYNVIMQRVGAETVLNEAVEVLGNDVYREALDESKIEPYAPGSLENIENDPTMKLTFVIAKQPEVDLGNYRDIRVPFEAPEVPDEDVTKAIKAMQDQRAVVETVERPAQIGDAIKAKIFATITHPASEDHAGEAGTEPHDHDHEGHDHEHDHEAGHTDTWMDEETETVLEGEDEELMAGFSPNIVGASAGDEREFSLSFPDDYKDKSLASHTFNFKVNVLEVKSRTLPILTDDFAKQATDGKIETLLDLRIDVRKQLQETATREAESAYADVALGKVVEQSTLKYPENIIEEYTDEILQNLDRNLRQRGLSLVDYKQVESKTDEQLKADYRDTAIKRLERSLVLGELVNREHIVINDADIAEQVDKMSAQFGDQAEIFRQMLLREDNQRGIALDLMTNKAVQRLIAIARGENPPLDPEPAQAALDAPSEIAPATEAAHIEAAAAMLDKPTEAAPEAAETAPAESASESIESTEAAEPPATTPE